MQRRAVILCIFLLALWSPACGDEKTDSAASAPSTGMPLTGDQDEQQQVLTVNPLYSISYDVKPEIKYTFRQPEPRPPKVVSDAFTLLVLTPIIILFALWAKLGVNIQNFPFTLSAFGFHIGLAAMFGVYTLFWIKLSMFEALKWLTIPGVITFVTGNRLLSHIAEQRGK